MNEDEHLQRITELIYDDNEIVTCSILSDNLNTRLQEAQKLLDKYVENADVPEQKDLSWTYIIIGTSYEGGYVISVVDPDEIDKKRSALKSVISQNVYSIHRKGIDSAALVNAEPFIESRIRKEPLQGSVVSKEAVKRKLKTQVVVKEEIKQESSKNLKQENQSKVEAVQNENSSKPKKNGIEGFCTKTNATQIVSKPIKNSIQTQQKNMMASFISKSFKTKEENETTTKESKTIEETAAPEEKMEIDDAPNKGEASNGKSISEKKDVKDATKTKKRKSEGKGNQKSKKRKRIVEAADSDSDIFASSESEIEVEPDIHLSDDNFEGGETKSDVPIKPRRMKQITEEFMDEDGYMNTTQRYVVMSDEEDDELKEQRPSNGPAKSLDQKPPVQIKKSPVLTKKESTKNGKGKDKKAGQNQPSILTFFKKV